MSKIATCKKQAKKARNRRASLVFLFAVGFVNDHENHPRNPVESVGFSEIIGASAAAP